MPSSILDTVGFRLLQIFERWMVRFSPHGDLTFFDPEEFPWARDLEENWQVIRKELDQVLQHRDTVPNFQDISSDQRHLTTDDRWKTYFLYGFGYKAEENCKCCPETTRLVEQVPGMKTAFFSILAPGKHIPPHRGPYKGVIRYHLGLKVPEPAEKCRIRVGSDIRHWEEGGCIMFDDTHEHEVWNEPDGERAILFMDVERPLDPPMDVVNKLIISLISLSPFVREARETQEKWETRLEEKAGAAEAAGV